MKKENYKESYQKLTPLGKIIRFLANFLLIPALLFYFTDNIDLANFLFVVWIISGILTWIAKIK